VIERIHALRTQAEGEIAAATTADELEQLRVRHLGRRAELPQLLRGVRELPPQERGAVGKAANERSNRGGVGDASGGRAH
jgi:phenylalanyl-tRNA synthetase alpha chain